MKRRQIIAEVDWRSAFAMIYPKAIYLVEGEPFEVQELRFREDEEKVAYVKRVDVDYFTDAVSAKGVWILQRLGRPASTPGLLAEQGEVLVAEKVVGFKKIKMGTMENVGSGEVELPQQEMQTTSAWLTARPGAARGDLAAPRRAGRRAARAEPPAASPGPDLPAVRHPRPGLLARRRLAVRGGRRWSTREIDAGPAPAGRALHPDDLPLRQPARRHRAGRAHLRGAARAARARPRDARGVRAAGAAARRAWGR